MYVSIHYVRLLANKYLVKSQGLVGTKLLWW